MALSFQIRSSIRFTNPIYHEEINVSKYGHRTYKWFEEIVDKLGGEAAADALIRGELEVSQSARSWREEDGVIYFSVKSDSTTGEDEDWIKCLEDSNFLVGDNAKQLLRSPDFKSTMGVTTEVAVLKGMLFEDSDRVTERIRSEADNRKFSKPNAELACLIRRKFTDKEIEAMGLCHIVAMHEPISDSDGDSRLLRVHIRGAGCCLDAFYVRPDYRWNRDYGFAFVVPQVIEEDCHLASS